MEVFLSSVLVIVLWIFLFHLGCNLMGTSQYFTGLFLCVFSTSFAVVYLITIVFMLKFLHKGVS